ncbi:ribonuclease H-like domain-containing protein [Tanacetum coccineum]
MINKPDIDEIDIDDLYNNLRVYEDEMKRSLSFTTTSQNLTFLFSENTSSTNEVNTASGDFRVSTAGGISQIDKDDLEELDLRWQVAMLTVRCYNCHRKGHFVRECRSRRNQGRRSYGNNGRSNAPTNESSSQALVAQDGLGGYDWSNDFEVEPNYDSEREKHSRARLEIQGYELALESLESRILVHKKNELAWGEKYEELPTPRADISFAGLDEYAIRKKIIKSKTTDLNTKTSETVDDEDDMSEVQTVNLVKTNDKIGQTSKKAGIGFKKIKACFVLWANAKRVNHQKFSNKLNYPQARRTFVPSGVLTRTGLVNPVRPNEKRAVQTINTARPVSTARSVSTARPFAPKTAQTSSAVRPIYPRMDNVRPRASSSQIRRSYYIKPAFRPKNLKQDVKTSRVKNMTTAGTRAVVNTGKGKMNNDLKKSRWVWRPKGNYMDHESKEKGSFILKKFEYGNPEICLQDHVVVDSGCSSHMTGNKAYLSDYEDYNRGFVAFGSDPKGGKITGKGKIRTANLDFDDVYFVDELKFNLFSVSQMCDKKNSVLFTNTECLILSLSFKLLDENQVVLRAPRQNGVYSLDLKNIVPFGDLVRCDHGTEFKNHAMNEFYAKKGIKREFSVARTPQQNGVAERKNKTLIEAARTMLADSLLPIPF